MRGGGGSGDAAGACGRDRCADAGRGGGLAACGALDVCAGAARTRRRCAIWRRAGSGRWRRWCGMRRSPARAGRSPSDSAAGCADAGRDRAAGEPLSARSRTSCRCRRCRRGCCSTRCTTRAGPDVYTVQLELELDGALDGAALQASMPAVIGRHASLRAAFWHEQLEPSGAGDGGAGGGAVAADRSVGAGCGGARAAAGGACSRRTGWSGLILPRRRCCGLR